jgi:ketosteroid isomerase-like protein
MERRVRADTRTEADVKQVLKRLADSYKHRDLEGVLAHIAPDEDVVLYGTGADEKRVGMKEIRKQVERDWAQTDEIAMEFDVISVSAAGSVAWAAIDGKFEARVNGQEMMSMPTRLTCVLERRNDDWLIVQSHFSAPTAGRQEGQSLPA